MAELTHLQTARAQVVAEPGRVVVVHDDGQRDVYPIGLAREWSGLLARAASAAELLERAAAGTATVARLRIERADRSGGAACG
jgi:hypothetical protein